MYAFLHISKLDASESKVYKVKYVTFEVKLLQANFKKLSITLMGLVFALTTPMGIGIGIGITKVYDENSPTALIVEGIFNAASAGILIYMALVDLLAADFMNPIMQKSGSLRLVANLSLLLGACCISPLAKWA